MQLSQRRFQEKQNLLASLAYWEQNIENCYEGKVALIPVIQYSERRRQEACQQEFRADLFQKKKKSCVQEASLSVR